MQPEAFEKSIDLVYDEVEFGGLAALPSALTRAIGARSSSVQITDALLRPQAIASNYFPADILDQYVADAIFESDPWADVLRDDSMRERPINCEGLVSHTELMRSRLWNQFIRNIGDDTAHCIGFGTYLDADVMLTVGMHRGLGAHFDDQDVLMLGKAIPHARRAIRLHRRLSQAIGEAAISKSALEHANQALLILDANAHILLATRSAEAILSAGSALRVTNGRLEPTRTPAKAEFAKALANAAHRSGARGGRFVLRDDSGTPCLLAEITPFTAAIGSAALVMLFEESARSDFLEDRVMAFFELSRSEAQVASAIAQGFDLAEIATQRSTSINTIRTLVQRCFAKTRTGRQAELAIAINALR